MTKCNLNAKESIVCLTKSHVHVQGWLDKFQHRVAITNGKKNRKNLKHLQKIIDPVNTGMTRIKISCRQTGMVIDLGFQEGSPNHWKAELPHLTTILVLDNSRLYLQLNWVNWSSGFLHEFQLFVRLFFALGKISQKLNSFDHFDEN